MTKLETGRKTTENNQDLVVFLIGARVNKWWLLPFALPVLAKMRRMQQELLNNPDSGLLAIQSLGGADVQYWRSLRHLQRYAGDKSQTHKPTASKFYRKLFRNRSIGVWHETYLVRAGAYESLYLNMPAHGLGRALPLVPAEGERANMQARLSDEHFTSN